ncbi:MAG TPA: septum formation initiator family protein [Actinomycetes bacterium]|jgi:cell division protein FtsB|nr:septum formation initiator family protein [Actinomycetes bacterium]
MSKARPPASLLAGVLGHGGGRGRGAARRGGRGRGGGRAPAGLTSRGLLLSLVLFVLAATAVYPLREYVAQQDRIDQLRAKRAALQAANQRLERERARLQDPAYIDQLAKQEFQLVEPGEQSWLLTGTPPADSSAAAASRPAPRRPWYKRVWHWLSDWAT